MKAAVYYETGSPDVFRYEDVPDPSAGPGDVLIDMAVHLDLEIAIALVDELLSLGRHLRRRLDGQDAQDRNAVARAFKNALTQGSIDVEGRIRNQNDAQTRLLQIKGKTYYDAGKPARIAGVLVDITERRASQDSLDRARESLFQSQKMEAVGQLTGGVAHDFNNLLMAVLGSLELLRKRLPDDPQQVRLLDNAILGAKRGAILTQRMLAFARRQDLEVRPLDLAALVRGMSDLLERSLGRDVEIEMAFPPDLAQIVADQNQLELALLNLCVNARDAMPNGGQLSFAADNVELTAAEAAAPRCRFRARADRDLRCERRQVLGGHRRGLAHRRLRHGR